MPRDRDSTGDVRAELPALSGRLRTTDPGTVHHRTLAHALAPIVDVVRQIPVQMGLRPHRVFLVHAAWSGGRAGAGHLDVTSRVEVLPVPRVRQLGAVAEVLRATGVTEEGDVQVDRISARFAEDDLRGITPDMRDAVVPRTLAPQVDFWWEVVEVRPVDPQPIPRRFNIMSAELSRGRAEWVVRLARQDYDRGRRGETERGAF